MAQPSSTPDQAQDEGSALHHEADPVESLKKPAAAGEDAMAARESDRSLNDPAQIEQDQRNDRARADARAAGGGPDAPEGGLNQDG